MVIKCKYKLLKVKDRVENWKLGDKGLEKSVIILNCFVFQEEEYDSPGEADEFRSYKDHPDDYLIIQVW